MRFLTFLCSFVTLLLLGSCCCHNSILDGGRRPQVLPDPVCSVIDYDFDCEMSCDPPCEEDGDDSDEPPEDRQYRFSLGDVVDISVLEEDEVLIDGVVVAPDGNIYYALLDAIPAVGRTVSEVCEEMEKKLEKYFIKPIVTIVPKVSNTQVFKIMGRVRRPGVYDLTTEVRLREAIAIAGDLMNESYKDKDSDSDLLPLANLYRSYLLRNGTKVPVDFHSLLFDPNSESNILVQADDFIYIAPSDTSDVYILGAVQYPNRFIWRKDITLSEVLASAGGWRYSLLLGANLKSVLLVRGPLEAPCAMCIDYTRILDGSARDLLLQPGDIIYVHNQTLRFGRLLVRIAINSFLQSFGIAGGSYYGIEWFNFSREIPGAPHDAL